MKCIGHKTGPSAWTRPLANPSAETPELFIMPENQIVPAPMYHQIGWILPRDADQPHGGTIYEHRGMAGANSVAVFVKLTEPVKPDPIPAISAAEQRITALEKAFVMLVSQNADVIEAQRAIIERLTKQVQENYNYIQSVEALLKKHSFIGNDERRWQAALAALPAVLAACPEDETPSTIPKRAAELSYLIADAMIAADVPTSDQAHTD